MDAAARANAAAANSFLRAEDVAIFVSSIRERSLLHLSTLPSLLQAEVTVGKRRDQLQAWFSGPEGPRALFSGRVLVSASHGDLQRLPERLRG